MSLVNIIGVTFPFLFVHYQLKSSSKKQFLSIILFKIDFLACCCCAFWVCTCVCAVHVVYMCSVTVRFLFCSPLPQRHKLLCCPSEWVSVSRESEPKTNSTDFDLILRHPWGPRFSSENFTEMLPSYIFGPSVVKYGILSNSRHSKLNAVIDCLIYYICQELYGWLLFLALISFHYVMPFSSLEFFYLVIRILESSVCILAWSKLKKQNKTQKTSVL